MQTMSATHHNQDGFTLIEIVAVLILLGILSAVAVPKFFDLEGEAEAKAVLSAAAEVQSRLDATFSSKVLEGTSCTDAVAFASDLKNLSDNGGSLFGGFDIQKSGEDTAPSLRYKKTGDTEWKTIANFTLVLPLCSSESSVSPTFSQAGLDIWKAMINNTFDIGSSRDDESDPYKFASWYAGGNTRYYFTMSQNKAAVEGIREEYQYRVLLAKNNDLNTLDKVVVDSHWGTEYGTQGDNLLKEQPGSKPESRNERIELFKTHCANWETLFEIRTSATTGYQYLVAKYPEL